jgi:hypothetical protein
MWHDIRNGDIGWALPSTEELEEEYEAELEEFEDFTEEKPAVT